MARMTIYVPDDLRSRMKAVAESVNWSEVACRAFELKLGELVQQKEIKDMKDVIARLRASKIHDEDKQFKEGCKLGEEWAKDYATAAQLKRLEALDLDFLDEHVSTAPWTKAEYLAFEIEDTKKDDYDESVADEFWDCAVGGDVDINDIKFLRGFVKGALDIWNQVAEHL